MSYHRPILTSDMDFAHHICGNAALYFNPMDVDDICKAILQLKNEPGLYQKLVEEAQNRLKLKSMSWDEIAKNIVLELEKISKQ